MEWKRLNETSYELRRDSRVIATLSRHKWNESQLETGGLRYTIATTGLWNNHITITSEKGDVALDVTAEKWYASQFEIAFRGQKYQLQIRNNPLCEFVIRDHITELLAYGLYYDSELNRLVIRISEGTRQDLILHALLWHFMEPIGRENFGDDLWWTSSL